MSLTVRFLLLLPLASVLASNQPAEQYYRELNCSAIPSAGSTKYDCAILDELDNETCFYDGIHYPVGASVSGAALKEDCIVECRCDSHSGKSHFSCVNIECPSLFNPTWEEGCVNLYERGKCCPVGKHCDKKDPPVPTCEYGGKTYKKGEQFYPEEQCTSCICMEGFNGTLSEPWCKKTQCNMYLHYGQRIKDGCVPTYYRTTDCCPIPVWRCPSDNDAIVSPGESSDNLSPKHNDGTCKFGQLLLEVGQMLSRSKDRCVECSCSVPPQVSCIMNIDCYENQK